MSPWQALLFGLMLVVGIPAIVIVILATMNENAPTKSGVSGASSATSLQERTRQGMLKLWDGALKDGKTQDLCLAWTLTEQRVTREINDAFVTKEGYEPDSRTVTEFMDERCS